MTDPAGKKQTKSKRRTVRGKGRPLGASDFVWAIIGLALMGYLAYKYMPEFPIVMFGLFAASIVADFFLVRDNNEGKKRELWTSWVIILGTLLSFCVLQAAAVPTTDPYFSKIFRFIPAIFYVAMLFTCHRANNSPESGLGFVGMGLLIISWFISSYKNASYYHDLFCLINDAIMLVLLIHALSFLIQAFKRHKPSAVMFPVICFAVYYISKPLTGFYGYEVAKNLIMGLIH